MRINVKNLGICELEVCVEQSAVDSFFQAGWSETLDRKLTEEELDYIQRDYSDLIQEYSYQNGSRNHN